ncbi:MAG: YibE/F family protein [Ilumatobacteraceae bacterium]
MATGQSHPHSHQHPAGEFASRDTARVLRLLVIACGVAVVFGAALLWPSGSRTTDPLGLQADPVDAHVVAVEELPCAGIPDQTCAVVSFELRSGPQAGTAGSMEQSLETTIRTGDDIRVGAADLGGGGGTAFSFYDFQRSTPLILLVLLFVAAVVALGRWRGVGAIVGLAASLVVIVWFALPSLTDGHSAVAVALVTAGAVAILALYLAHGFGPATDVALLSTFASLAITGVLAWIFVEAARFTGLTDDATFVLQSLGTVIDPRGILLAGIVIGSLGVLDDVTVTQVSAVWELHDSRPDAPRRELFTRALTIGRDHISSTVNTLFLAYAGAALPLLLLFSGVGESVTGVATREVVAIEIVRALVGSIGLVASVPISTALAVQVVGTARIGRRRIAR